MLRATLRWLISSLVLVFIVTVLTFILVSMAPGDAAKAILGGESATYSAQQYQQVRHLLGIDQPLPIQYWNWLVGLVHGSLGTDLFTGQPVTQILNARLIPTLSIVIGTVIVSTVVGLGLGVASAVRGGVLGRIVDTISLLGFAIPNFWLALVLVEVFAVQIRIFPAIGYTDPGTSIGGWIVSLVLPVAALAAGGSAFIAKQTRDAMGEVMARDFIMMLRARGLSTRSIIFKHGLRNAAIPVVTMIGLLLISLLGGTVLVENIFAIPGLGELAVNASGSHDIPVIEGIALYFTVIVVLTNLVVDISYRLLNPRVRHA